MRWLSPRNLYRHGQLADEEHRHAREHIDRLARHLVSVRNLAEMNAPATNPVGRPSGTAEGPGPVTVPAGHPLAARDWRAAGRESAGPKLMTADGVITRA
jgi:hypothetical protein